MTSAKPIFEQVIRQAAALPLARIAAALLAAATGFFCYAMPQRVLDSLLGAVGVAVPVGLVGRTLFVLFFAGLAAILGWLVVTVAGSGAGLAEVENETDLEEPAPRRRNVGPIKAIEAAPQVAAIAVRRGDSHPDAPPRRPIFADEELPDLGDPLPLLEARHALPEAAESAIETVAPVDPAPAEVAEPEEVIALPPAVEPEPEPQPAAEPLELIDTVPPVAKPAPEIADEPPTLAALMARFERGLDQRGSDLPPVPSAARIAALQEPEPQAAADDTLRTALEALQRMAARQR